jgi:hypothetical protein
MSFRFQVEACNCREDFSQDLAHLMAHLPLACPPRSPYVALGTEIGRAFYVYDPEDNLVELKGTQPA